MKREQIEKLLGGYATGTLTASERAALLAAALEDQQLFEELLREEPLREVLEDPATRARLLEALGDAPESPVPASQPWYYRDVPASAIAAALGAIAIVALAVEFWPVKTAPPVNVVAKAVLPQPSKSPLPARLPQFVMSGPAHTAPPVLPPAPVLSPQAAALPDLETLLAQNSNSPVPPFSALSSEIELARTSLIAGDLSFRPQAASASAGLRYSILKKLPSGVLQPVDPRQQLAPNDATVIRFMPRESGYLYLLEKSPNGWRRIAAERIERPAPVILPREGAFHNEGSGPREFQILFLPLVPTAQSQSPPLPVVLRYPPR